jgi:hypothetical protein
MDSPVVYRCTLLSKYGLGVKQKERCDLEA